jgi:hypothetical protein
VVEPVNGDHFFLEWTQPPEAGGYLLRYGPAGCVVPEAATIADEGPSAIVLPAQLDFELHGLTPAQLYWFEVAAIDEYGLPGQPVRAEAMLLDGPDNNGDGLPDAWAAYYGLVSPGGDRDQDGLDNLGEYQQFSNPLHADSDGDGFYDSYELEWGTDVCGPEQPPYHTQPVLTIFGQQHYNLRTATNQGPAGDTLEIVNFGAGQMFWQVSTNVSWLTFDRNSGSGDATVTFAANPAGLPPGFYNTTVSISTLSPPGMRAAFIGETAEVEVTFVVMPEMLSSLFLPVMSR